MRKRLLSSLALLWALGVASTRVEGAAAVSARHASVDVQPIRARWPVMREASGGWVVLGEATARLAGSRPVDIRSVRVKIFGPEGTLLARQAFEGQGLREILEILAFDAEGNPTPKPDGTTLLEPGDVGIVGLGTLAGRRSTPRRAEITFGFDIAPARRAVVPLFAFNPGPQISWPLSFASGRPWVALNTFSPANPISAHRLALLPTPQEFFISQRFAIDCAQVDEDGRTSNPPSSPRKEEYYAWDQEIQSAAAGEVVAVVTDEPEQEIGSQDPLHPGGNYVVVRHGPGLFSFYGHMMRASATVSVGDLVERGQPMGRVGNSGNTTEPHLHVHFMDRWDGLHPVLSLFTSQGLPAVFDQVHVRRGDRTFRLRGSAPLDGDLLVP